MSKVSRHQAIGRNAVQPVHSGARGQAYGKRTPSGMLVPVSEAIVSSTLEAQRSLFSGSERESTALRSRAANAYGQAERLEPVNRSIAKVTV